MHELEILGSLDYSHPTTTDRIHCLELFNWCRLFGPASTLELGAGYGVSGVAVGLGSGGQGVIVDNGREVRGSVARALWQKHGVRKQYVSDDARLYLGHPGRERVDVIFHDATHGPGAVPEYLRCWELTRRILLIHDVDRIDWRAFVASLSGVSTSGFSIDARGRALGYVLR